MSHFSRFFKAKPRLRAVYLKNGQTPLFVIAILEHESKVNFRSSFKMLQYIYLVLDAWEKEIDRESPRASSHKDFKYPPVLPIIFYDGKVTWTAEKNFLNRTWLNQAFENYIPKFEYELVDLNQYNEEEIMKFGDALSFILLVDKIRNSKGKSLLSQIPEDYIEKLRLQIPDNMNKLLLDVTLSLLGKSGLEPWEEEKVALYIEKADKKEYGGMFEAVLESIKEGQEEAREEGRLEEKEASARNALNEGLPIEMINRITGLDMEKIRDLSGK